MCSSTRVFQIVLRGEGVGNFAGGDFLLGDGNLISEFDHLNPFKN